MKKFIKIIVITTLLGLTGGSGYLGYEYWVLQEERDDLKIRLEAAEKKVDLLQNRYKEQKALEANLMRTKLSLEGRIGKLQSEVKDLQEENTQLMNDKSYLSRKLSAENKALKTKITDLALQNQALAADLQNEKQRHAQTVKGYEARIRTMESQAKSLDLNLKRSGLQLDRCKEHNARLAEIGVELLYRYENKGVVGSLLQNEPFTQMQKVELENLVQEYTDKIEKEQIN